jgi:ribosomal protein S27AE
MKRGLNQVLFQYMPGKTFDNPEHQTIERVVQIGGDDISDEVNDEHLKKRVFAAINEWEGGSREYLSSTLDNFSIIQPEDVISEVFPLVLRCDDCYGVENYERIRDSLKSGSVSCSNCGGSSLHQLHHVLICGECSEIESLSVPPCDDHDWDYIKLDDSAESYRNFRWRCGKCEQQGRDATIRTGLHRSCDNCGTMLQPTVHRASQAYRVHHLKQVDINFEYGLEDDEEKKRDISDIALGAAYGIYEHPDNEISFYRDKQESGTSQIEELLGGDIVDEEQKAEIREQFSDDLKASGELTQILNELGEVRQTDRNISRNHFNYLRTLEEIETETLDELDSDIGKPGESPEDVLQKYGVSDLRLTSEFPILTAVYGYHRTFDDPDEDEYPSLRAFPYAQGSDTIPIYATSSDTEAVFLTLNHRRVGEWLAANGLLEASVDDLSDPELRALIHAEMDEMRPYVDADDMTEVSRYVHGLLHTLSHRLIEEAAMLSGIEETSLAEFMFPEALSVAIYSNQTHSFTIGGLYTLAERSLEEWFDSVQQESEHCIYDPVCSEQGATCHACTHISEIGCQHFNQNLSRGFLFGRTNQETPMTGYWDDF